MANLGRVFQGAEFFRPLEGAEFFRPLSFSDRLLWESCLSSPGRLYPRLSWFPNNVARNSPATLSNFEIGPLQFQRL